MSKAKLTQLLRRAVELLEQAKNACETEGDFCPVDAYLAREIEEFIPEAESYL